nr:MAG TPA: hypothetical protein [Caudoviricetes sp.]
MLNLLKKNGMIQYLEPLVESIKRYKNLIVLYVC